ncbi:MAG: ATP-binding protein, partial [Nocardioides sp.]|uniref:ATP-binding protein n=1 Tax=Nocardioides sp. TaxID=35761 RepID=UPI00239C009E
MSDFRVDTHIFRELGALLVGRDSTALAELIKNCYDADATDGSVRGQNLRTAKLSSVVVSDNGNGMTKSEFERGFLTIASRST